MNETIFRFLNDFAGSRPWLDAVIVFSAEWLGWALVFGLIFYLFGHIHGKARTIKEIFSGAKTKFKEVAIMIFSAIFALLLSEIAKSVFGSPRPFEVLGNINLLFSHGGGDAFPSGHATFFSALALAIYPYHKKLAIFYFIGAILIGLGRIASGIHWPIDILAGYLLGGAIGFSVSSFLKKRI